MDLECKKQLPVGELNPESRTRKESTTCDNFTDVLLCLEEKEYSISGLKTDTLRN